MLNPFPSLLAYGLVAPLIIRVVLGVLFLGAGYIKIFKNRERCGLVFSEFGLPAPAFWVFIIGGIELVGGLALLFGAYTQITAMLLSAVTLKFLFIKIRRPELLENSYWFYILVLTMAVSLVFSSAGFWAFDLPL